MYSAIFGARALTSIHASRRFLSRLLGGSLLLLAASAHAQTGHTDTMGLLSGLLHPLGGADHLLAMLAVGIWASSLGRAQTWALPVAFPLLMVVGGLLGIGGVSLPYVEPAIAVSVVVLGLAIAAAWRAPKPVALALVAAFGVFHGYAHGTELPQAASPFAYVVGFVLSTVALHLGGIALGWLARMRHGVPLLRTGGGMIAATGAWMLVGMPGMT